MSDKNRPRGKGGNRGESNQARGGDRSDRQPNRSDERSSAANRQPNRPDDRSSGSSRPAPAPALVPAPAPTSSAWGPPLGARGKKHEEQKSSSNAPAWGNRPDAVSRSQPEHQARVQETSRVAPAWGPSQARQAPPASSTERKPLDPRAQGTAQPQASTTSNAPAWGPNQPRQVPDKQQSKRERDTEQSTSTTKFHADERTRGEAARGAIHGNRNLGPENILETRPAHINAKRGAMGTPLPLTSNYFRLVSKAQWTIYHYNVEFRPEIENPRFRNALLMQQRETLGGYLYDKGASIYITRQLHENRFEFVTRDRDGQEVLMIITLVGILSTLEATYVQVLNLIMKKAIKGLNLQLIGRDYFDAAASIDIREFRLQLWPGYTTSIRQHENSLLMMAEIKHKLMRNETVLDILQQIYNDSRRDWQREFSTRVLGMTVLTTYNNKTYRIDDVDYSISPSSVFETKDGPVSYIDYYLRRYEIKIRDASQPLLISRANERDIRAGRASLIALVPELCNATGYTDEMRKNFRLMKAVAEHTRVGPTNRVNKLLEFNSRLHATPESINCIREWQLNLENRLVELSGRQLLNENILFGQDQRVEADNQASWNNALQGKCRMYVTQDLDRWIVVVPQRLQNDMRGFLKMLRDVGRGMSFNINEPEYFDIPDDRSNTLNAALDKACNRNPKLVMIAVSNNQADRYSVIKKMCCVQRPVPSQVVTARNINPKERKTLSIATKVAIQMNAKIGGAPWLIEMPLNNLMTIGYDVCHDSRDKSKSYGALVATMDLKVSQAYFSSVSAHTNGEELSNNLSLNVIKAIKQYQTIHGVLPGRIMFYRDGVGEGQTNYVFEHELTHLRSTLQQYYQPSGQPLKLCFIIVSKRINTKFFLNNNANVPAGTVVDDVVTLPERYDFFLVSQAVTQGTATPTNYNILYDTFGLPPEKVQWLTYKMTHLYYNWTGTTRVPAVCQYAHKLAFLVGQFIHQSPSPALEKSLYFL